MLYGLTGASGTGKTTLAKAIANDLGIEYISASISESAKKHGFNSVSPMPIHVRLTMQRHLLEDHTALIALSPRPAITDRTPLDMISYMLAEIGMHDHEEMTRQDCADIEQYVDDCIKVTSMLYDRIYILSQLDEYEEVDTRPVTNRAYQSHTQLIMMGTALKAAESVKTTFIMNQDFETRREQVTDYIVARMNEIQELRQSCSFVH